MSKFSKYFVMFCYGLSLIWLIATVIGGTTGIIVGCLFLGLVGAMMFRNVSRADVNAPLLMDVLLVLSNVLLYNNLELWPLTLSLGLAGLFDIINRLVKKNYRTESWRTFLIAELRLPPLVDLLFLLFLITDAVLKDMTHKPYVWLFATFFILDFLRQVFLRKR